MSRIMELADAYAKAAIFTHTVAFHESRAALAAEIERVEKDAARYRWLREQNADLDAGFYVGDETDALPEDITWVGADLDAAIDAAMKEVADGQQGD